MKRSALDAVVGQDCVIGAVGLDVGEACVEHFDQFRIGALQNGEAVVADLDLVAHGLQIQFLCGDLVVNYGEVLKARGIVAIVTAVYTVGESL